MITLAFGVGKEFKDVLQDNTPAGLFFHYYFRSVTEARKRVKDAKTEAALFLDEKGTDWQKPYAPGSFKTKRVAMFAEMKGAAQG